MTARRRLRTVVERGLVSNGDGWTITDAGRDLVGPRTPWLRPIKAESVRHHREGFSGMFSIRRYG
jgi:hypothetical protein